VNTAVYRFIKADGSTGKDVFVVGRRNGDALDRCAVRQAPGGNDAPDSSPIPGPEQAQAAAARAATILAQPSLSAEPNTAYIDEDLCSGCSICISVCPYKAIESVKRDKKMILIINIKTNKIYKTVPADDWEEHTEKNIEDSVDKFNKKFTGILFAEYLPCTHDDMQNGFCDECGEYVGLKFREVDYD
jgi:NAD-dependent dihydropyrimidine dehydrogenase PreA subunit